MGKKSKNEKPEAEASGPNVVEAMMARVSLKQVVTVLVSLAALSTAYTWHNSPVPIRMLDPKDTEALKEVFFSPTGDPWVVMCEGKKSEDALPLVFSAAHQALWRQAGFATLNCRKKLSSGKTTYERFGLEKHADVPTVFVVANGRQPAQIPAKTLGGKKKTVSWIKDKIALSIKPVASDADLQRHCLRRKRCLVLDQQGPLSKDEQRSVFDLMKAHRTLPVVAVGPSAKLSIGSHLPSLPGTTLRVGYLQRDNAAGEDLRVSLAAFASADPLSADSLLDFVAQIEDKSLALTALGDEAVAVTDVRGESAEDAAARDRQERKDAFRAEQEEDPEAAARAERAEERRRRERLIELEREQFAQAATEADLEESDVQGGDEWEDAEEIEL